LKPDNSTSIWQRIRNSSLFIKMGSWEYWPIYIVNIPVVFIWLFYAIRSRSLFFFSTVNPVIETGGVFGESKINILNRIPKDYLPVTIFIKAETSEEIVLQKLKTSNLTYPIIAKPNVGERGLLVAKIENESELLQYTQSNKVDFLIQEFISLALEVSILHYRFPDQQKGKVTSICIKDTLKVTGDGVSNIESLMEKYPRAKLQLERFQSEFSELLKQVPKKGELVELEPIGNHCRGTTFLNGNEHIDENLDRIFDAISLQMEGIYYGRFDMKCSSIDAIKKGEKFKVLEFNGIASEPAHIYDPSYPVWKAYKDIYQHWKIIYQIGKQQRAKGIDSMKLKEVVDSLRTYFSYLKMIKQNT